MLVLVAGDAHIPDRATNIPEPIEKLLVPGKIDQVVLLGNTSEPSVLHYLNKLAPKSSIISVLGDSDIPGSKSHTTAVFGAGRFRIGVVSSFLIVPAEDIDALAALARKLDVDILLWGGSNRQETQSWAGHYFITPGSLTGAISAFDGEETESNPGFCLLDINNDSCTLFMYQLHNGNVTVEKAQLPYIARTAAGAGAASNE